MNKIKSITTEPKMAKVGNIFYSEYSGEYYMLVSISGKYTCVRLTDGGVWEAPSDDIDKAWVGLKLIGDVQITLQY